MVIIEFPETSFNIETRETGDFIFDPVRKYWVKITPEEWVRQNLINFLNKALDVPLSLIAVEKKLQVGELARRFDLVVYSRGGKPWLLIECKAMDVALSKKTISQMLAYLSVLQCPYFFISNGNNTYGWQVSQNQIIEINAFPQYQ